MSGRQLLRGLAEELRACVSPPPHPSKRQAGPRWSRWLRCTPSVSFVRSPKSGRPRDPSRVLPHGAVLRGFMQTSDEDRPRHHQLPVANVEIQSTRRGPRAGREACDEETSRQKHRACLAPSRCSPPHGSHLCRGARTWPLRSKVTQGCPAAPVRTRESSSSTSSSRS